MNKLLVFIGIVLFLFGALTIGGYHLFGLGGACGGLILFLVLTKLTVCLVKKRFKQVGKALFDSKSKVLRNATAIVNKVSSAPRVENEDPPNAGAPTNFYFLDVTITPAPSDGTTPFHCWDYSELQLVPFEAPAPDFDAETSGECEGSQCHIHQVTPLDVSEENDSCTGGQRFRMHVEIPEQTNRLKFQYYFETFGDVTVRV